MYEAERRIILNHQTLKEQVRERVTRFAQAEWSGLGSWRDSDIERFVARVVPVVESGQKTTAQLTANYLQAMARMAGIRPPPGVIEVSGLRGVPLAEVYARPAVTTYTALSEGRPLTEALRLAALRLDALIALDLQMANTRTAHSMLSGDGRVAGWQRVLSPGENCALCAIASTQRYHKETLMPIHAHCRCDVAPIYGDSDPGQVINAERLLDAQKVLEDEGLEYTSGRFKTDRSIRIRNHGEYGPTLTWADQHFTGPDDL